MNPHDRAQRFVDFLGGLVRSEDRAALAALRRGLTVEPHEAVWMLRYLREAPIGELKPWEEEAYLLVASLFAWHPLPWPASSPDDGRPTNLGASLAQLADAEERRLGQRPASVEKRFEALIHSHPEDLPLHLRNAVGLLRSQDIPVDWAQLLRDILQWERDDRRVQWQWARAFWHAREADADTGDTTPDRKGA